MSAPLSYQSYVPGVKETIPEAAAGYDGTDAELVTQGSADGSSDVCMKLVSAAEILDGNVIRVFTSLDSGATMIPEYQLKLHLRAKADPDLIWQFSMDLPPIRLTGANHEIYISQQLNDTSLMVKWEKRNLGF